jgi:hypothetical protein
MNKLQEATKLLISGLEKAKKMPIGTVSRGRKKVAEGKWVPVKEGKSKTDKPKKKNSRNGKDKISRDELKRKAETYNNEGDFKGYYLNDDDIDEIAKSLNVDTTDTYEMTDAIEKHYKIQLDYIDQPSATIGEYEVTFKK